MAPSQEVTVRNLAHEQGYSRVTQAQYVDREGTFGETGERPDSWALLSKDAAGVERVVIQELTLDQLEAYLNG